MVLSGKCSFARGLPRAEGLRKLGNEKVAHSGNRRAGKWQVPSGECTVLTFFRWEMQVRELLAPGIGFSNFEFRFGLMRSHQELENVNLPCQGREHGFRVDHRENGIPGNGANALPARKSHFPVGK